MRFKLLLSICALSILLVPSCVQGQDTDKNKTFEALSGDAYKFKTPMRVEQSGQPDLHFDAKFRTRPFDSPLYYDIRFAKWNGDKGKELELIHDKIFLTNGPAEIQHFEVSHGFNMLMMNEAWKKNGLIFHFGAGPVISHTESTVRDLHRNQGYQLSGAAMQFAVGKQFKISGNMFGTLEAKAIAGYARVGIADGHATVSDVGFHGLFGIGYRF
jgi:hypothetical protein